MADMKLLLVCFNGAVEAMATISHNTKAPVIRRMVVKAAASIDPRPKAVRHKIELEAKAISETVV